MKKQNVITWKDADRFLCTLAAQMLHNAGIAIRGGTLSVTLFKRQAVTHPVDDGSIATGGIGDEDQKRTYWSHGGSPYAAEFDSDGQPDRYGPSAVCWWSFQHMIRHRLEEARRELKEALYGQAKEHRWSDQRSRNKTGRKRGKSKFGWQAPE